MDTGHKLSRLRRYTELLFRHIFHSLITKPWLTLTFKMDALQPYVWEMLRIVCQDLQSFYTIGELTYSTWRLSQIHFEKKNAQVFQITFILSQILTTILVNAPGLSHLFIKKSSQHFLLMVDEWTTFRSSSPFTFCIAKLEEITIFIQCFLT